MISSAAARNCSVSENSSRAASTTQGSDQTAQRSEISRRSRSATTIATRYVDVGTGCLKKDRV